MSNNKAGQRGFMLGMIAGMLIGMAMVGATYPDLGFLVFAVGVAFAVVVYRKV